MKFVGLVSGGKDSIYNIMQCIIYGHELVCIANLKNKENKEQDSWMYQTVGSEVVSLIGQCLQVEVVQQVLEGHSLETNLHYQPNPNDEVEDLYRLLQEVQRQYPQVQGVSSGAILSNYQRLRIEHVCTRLHLTSLAYLWQMDQNQLIQEMIMNRLDVRLVKVCSLGLEPCHLLQSLATLQPHLHTLQTKYGLNVAGEGGEYESIVLDCPLFKDFHLDVVHKNIVYHDNHTPLSPVAYLTFQKVVLVPKTENEALSQQHQFSILISQQQQQQQQAIQSQQAEELKKQQESIDINNNQEKQEQLEIESDIQNVLESEAIDTLWTKKGQYLQSGLLSTTDCTLSPCEQLKQLLEQGQTMFNKHDMNLATHCIHVVLLVPDITQFQHLNTIYTEYFHHQPPT